MFPPPLLLQAASPRIASPLLECFPLNMVRSCVCSLWVLQAPAPFQQVGGAGVGAGVGKVASEERSKEQRQYAAEQSR